MKKLTIQAGTLLTVLCMAGSAFATVPKTVLKTYFERGDKPTEEQFSNLIDSYVHQLDDGITVIGIGKSGSTNNALRASAGDPIGPLTTFAHIGDPGDVIPVLEPLWAGESGFLPLALSNTLGEVVYGYFQIHMDSLALGDPPAIHVDYLVYEPSGDALLAAEVPEPASAALLAAGGGALLLWRRRRV